MSFNIHNKEEQLRKIYVFMYSRNVMEKQLFRPKVFLHLSIKMLGFHKLRDFPWRPETEDH